VKTSTGALKFSENDHLMNVTMAQFLALASDNGRRTAAACDGRSLQFAGIGGSMCAAYRQIRSHESREGFSPDGRRVGIRHTC